MVVFSWDDANVEHIAEHGVLPPEAEEVVRRAAPPFPRDRGDDRFLVWGRTSAGRYLQVVYVILEDEDVDIDSLTPAALLAFTSGESVARVIHAMDLTANQKS